MNSTKRRFIAVICFTALTLAGCGMNAETEKEYIGAAVTESTSEPEQTTKSKKTTTATTSNDFPDNREAYSPLFYYR